MILCNSGIATALLSILALIPLGVVGLASFTFFLAIITRLRQIIIRSLSSSAGKDDISSNGNTALYTGRVSHTRYKPVLHSFSYPLFFCLLDLSEIEAFRSQLWPLNMLMAFREEDHLKNGEGLSKDEKDTNIIESRIRRLVSQRTGGKCYPAPDQKVFILTHLCYFGYCFNPVSFYYILKGNELNDDVDDENIEAIVAEVSNTPWNEMKCYVLHPDSCDMQAVKEGRTRNYNTQNVWKSMNYVFQKTFHVSPFMEMDYIYDWTFWHLKRSRIVVNTLMTKNQQEERNTSEKGNSKSFSAFFDIQRSQFNPISLSYQLIRFPVYCFVIQIWIHYEALKLFVKGVEFIPHPEGSETRVSMIIAAVMVPFFALKEKFSSNENGLKQKKE